MFNIELVFETKALHKKQSPTANQKYKISNYMVAVKVNELSNMHLYNIIAFCIIFKPAFY